MKRPMIEIRKTLGKPGPAKATAAGKKQAIGPKELALRKLREELAGKG